MTHRGQPAPWLYLFGVIVWTWTFLGAVVLTGRPWLEFPSVLLLLVGGLGPAVVATLLVAAGRWDATLDHSALGFLRRALNPRTLPWRWYLWIVGLLLIFHLAPVLLEPSLFTQALLDTGPLAFLVVGFVFGALEEVGWRGYAQEGLQRLLPVVIASLVIGVFWALWHLPLFFIEGTYQSGLGVGTPAFWTFNLAILVSSPLYAWLYNAAGRVVFAAVLFHGLGNVIAEFVVDASPAAELAVTTAMTIIVTAVAWRWMRTRQAVTKRNPAAFEPKQKRNIKMKEEPYG